MDTATIISIVAIILMLLGLIAYIIYQIRKIGLKEFVVDMIIKAEEEFSKGENEEKMSYVINKVIALLPMPLSFFITENIARGFIQKIFDSIKKALDYVPKESEE